MSYINRVNIQDASGHIIGSHLSGDGDYHLSTATIQNIITSSNNFSEELLNDGSTWTGTYDEMLGATGIQVYHASDQPATIYIDQSPDPTFADSTMTITDSFGTIADEAKSEIFYSVAPYYRLRVTNTGLAPFTKHVTASGMTPTINPLPRKLSHSSSGVEARLETENTIRDIHSHRHQKVSPTYESYTVERNRLVGKAFVGNYKDENFWTESSTNGGYVTINGDAELATGTDAAGYCQYQSVHKARFVAGMVNEFVSVARFGQNPASGYKAQMGPYDGSNGCYFIIQDTSFGVGVRSDGVDTITWNGDFNGNLGPTIGGNFLYPNRYDIMYGGSSIEYFVGENLIHTHYAIFDPPSFLIDFPISAEIENTGSTTDNVIHVRGAAIFRIGELNTSPVYKYLSTAGDETVLKYGAGNLHRIVNNNNSGSFQIYDGIDSTSGKLIADIDATRVLGDISFDVDFGDGLVIVNSSPTASQLTVIYE